MQVVWIAVHVGCLSFHCPNGLYIDKWFNACPGCMAEPSRKALERYLKEER